jgi:multiple antibiotic resistance protein
MPMLESAIVAFTTFFATIAPLDVAMMFAALTVNETSQHRRVMAIRGTLTATIILVVFVLTGEMLLDVLGISLPAMRAAGGILLLLIGIDMVFARSSGAVTTTNEESREAELKKDISIFPLATPLIAGPGAMGAAILLTANEEGDISGIIIIIASLLAVLTITLITLLIAGKIQKYLGVIGLQVVTRIMGVLLAALAVQFIFDGIKQSGLLGG